MYQLFIADKNYSSWSLRPWLLLTELGIPFHEQHSRFDGPDNRQKFRSFAPNGKVPCLHHDGELIWESLAIIEYLAEQHPGVWPADAKAGLLPAVPPARCMPVLPPYVELAR